MAAVTNEHMKDAAFRILNVKYEVTVPRFATIDPDAQNVIGVTSYEADNPNERLVRIVTVDRMLAYAARGAIPAFKGSKHAKEVYDTITELIEDWTRAVYESPDHVEPPLEYLEQLEVFKQLIFPQARIGRAESILSTDINSVGALERYLSQRTARNDEERKRLAISKLATESEDAFSMIEKAIERRGGNY